MNDGAKPRVLMLLRAALAVLPLAWIARKVDVAGLAARFAELPFWLLGAAALAPLVAMGAASLRWRVLLGGYGADAPPANATLLRYVLVGAYFNLLPGAVAGDALRAFRTRAALGTTVDSLTVVFVERLAGLVGLIVLGVLGLLAADVSSSSWIVDVLLLGSVAALGASVVVLFGPSLYRRLRPPSGESRRASGWPARVGQVLDRWVRRVPPPRSFSSLAQAVLLSLFTQGVTVLQILILLLALAPEVSVTKLLPLLPLVVFLTYFPITPAAVGQREFVYVQVLAQAGVGPEAAVSTSIVVFGSLLFAAALGGVLYLLEGPQRRASVPPPGTPSWLPPSNSSSAP